MRHKLALLLYWGKKGKSTFETGYIFGHKVISTDEGTTWIYADNGDPVYDTDDNFLGSRRKCPQRDLTKRSDGHDPCLRTLPGVKNACCGHGVEDGYLQLDMGICITGTFYNMPPPPRK